MAKVPKEDARLIRETFERYREMLTRLLRGGPGSLPRSAGEGALGFPADAEDPGRVQVERGVVFPQFLLDPQAAAGIVEPVERLIAIASPEVLAQLQAVDRSGHHRPVYRPLLVYCWLQAFRLGYEVLPRDQFGRWEHATRAWCDDLERRLGEFAWPGSSAGLTAFRGDAAGEVCWTALALHVAGKVFIRDAWTDLAGDVFGKLARLQQPSGVFLAAGPSDNPETHWFHELVILHAAASYAVQAEDRALASAVGRATGFHLNETQPDHATHQPWGLFAFLWNPQTRSLADNLLHGAESLSADPAGPSGLALMLLADALYCLRLF